MSNAPFSSTRATRWVILGLLAEVYHCVHLEDANKNLRIHKVIKITRHCVNVLVVIEPLQDVV